MIDPKELRIGNWVKVDDLPIEQITLETFATLAQHPHTIGYFNPIPISPEWLERFNFEMDDDMEYGIIWSFKISDDASIYWNGFIEIEVRTKYVTTRYDLDHIKHIHQLQNLYHSLTGKELELKEKV
jgi:hypothetical protein